MDISRAPAPPPAGGGSSRPPAAPAPTRYPGAAGTTAALTVEQLKLLGCIVPALPAGAPAAADVRPATSSGGLGSLANDAPAATATGGVGRGGGGGDGGGGSDVGGSGGLGGGVGASHPRRRPTRDLSAFDRLEQVGEGAYGEVFMAREVATGDRVALKRVRMDAEREGLPVTAVREIKLLLSLRHENVVCLKEIVTSPKKALAGAPGGAAGKDDIYMVFEYMDHDLTGLLESPSLSHMVNEAALPSTGAGLRKRLRECGEGGAADLIAKLLALDPAARLTADEALDHDWFWTAPMPAEAADLPRAEEDVYHDAMSTF
ncbi:hypothetical protein I4F81_003798 [Pyropia yezoensis]|uniref:Uncharacterized protein n=1 Tax=Pyropia yezoensis TaxID=2788 RepID=A0ACC3BT56_PYRYE|nr:hypothetical protein I4F81_003798 [Neopyropia yezoensis]